MSSPFCINNNKKGDRQCEKSDSLCWTLFNTNPAGVVLTTLEDGLIFEVNDTMLDITGFSREEVLGKSILDIGFYPNNEVREEYIKILAEKKYIRNKEFYFFNKAKELHFGIFSAKIVEFRNRLCIFSSMFDISSKIDAQISFENTANKLKTLFESIPDMIFVVDYAGKILHTNNTVTERLGYTYEELKTMHILSLHPSDRKGDVVKTVGQILSGESNSCTIPLVTRSGKKIPVETKVVLTTWDDHDVILGISRDITERISMELKQQELEKMLRQTQKMEAIGLLAGGIAHDFNNILFPIIAYSEMLQNELPESSPFKDYANEIHSAAMRAKELVKQILTFSREATQEIQPLQTTLIVKEAIKLIHKTLPQSITIKSNINPKCKMVMADPTQIYQIAMNLIVNAFHAMELSGGTLTVKLDNVKREDGLDYILLSVQDTGIGMDEITIGKIFNPYFTTKSHGKGTGLGLSVVHGIVKLYKGEIIVKSKLNEGTIFDLYLPAIEGEEKSEQSSVNRASIKGNERILLVDDEDAVITPQTKILERLGYKVTPFTSSVEALKAFQKEPEAFDLVITDLSMPNISGTQLSSEMLKIRPKIPIILLTGFSYNLTPEKVKESGIAALITKPVIRSELTRTIRNVLGLCE
ncbi:MAG: PAS domain S-box protein [Desulfamplus sp.]|nr:PAS domain S-box protein [Desulfamplus sp.]